MKEKRGFFKKISSLWGTKKNPLVSEISKKKEGGFLKNSQGFFSFFFPKKAIDSTYGVAKDSISNFITLKRSDLSYMFLNNPVAHTIVTKPVQDALRGGIVLECESLGAEAKDVIDQLEITSGIDAIQNGFFWSRLYGGAAILINQENADPTEPFSIANVQRGEKIEFYALDRWQIETNSFSGDLEKSEIWYVNNEPIHSSRFLPIKNREVPSDLRATFQGWGYSELEKTVRALNTFQKSEDVFFELADEAKLDIYKIDGLNDMIASGSDGLQKVLRKSEAVAQAKNYYGQLNMDKNDDYQTKQINLSGVSQMNQEARLGLSIASSLPQDILIGNGASGFSSGEDVIERYNASVESEIRTQMMYYLNFMKQIIMKSLYGVVYQSTISFQSLRVLSAKQEQEIKESKIKNITLLFEKGIIDREKALEFLEKNNLLGV